MHTDLDARARQAAANLKTSVHHASLELSPPAARVRQRQPVGRIAWVLAALVFTSAIGLAMVVAPPEGPVASATTSTTQPPTPTTSTAPAPTAAPTPPPPTVEAAPVATLDTTPPPLTITMPIDGSESPHKTIEFGGTTEPGAQVFGGPYQATVDSAGNWRLVLVLSPGDNTARFTARDGAGNESQASVSVRYVAPAPTTTTTAKAEVAPFDAYAKFGFCSEPDHFDVYYGTGEPGSKVQVYSEYGQGSVVVGDQGQWELTVFFAGLEAEQTISVKVFDEFGRKKTFDFTYKP